MKNLIICIGFSKGNRLGLKLNADVITLDGTWPAVGPLKLFFEFLDFMPENTSDLDALSKTFDKYSKIYAIIEFKWWLLEEKKFKNPIMKFLKNKNIQIVYVKPWKLEGEPMMEKSGEFIKILEKEKDIEIIDSNKIFNSNKNKTIKQIENIVADEAIKKLDIEKRNPEEIFEIVSKHLETAEESLEKGLKKVELLRGVM